VRIDNRSYRERRTFTVDANVFDVLSFELLYGDPSNALREPYSIVLTESIAKKYFTSDHALGKTITIIGDREGKSEVYKVTGVMRDLPATSHFQIDFLTSFRSPDARTGWAYVYLLLQSGTDPVELEEKFPDFIETHNEEGSSQNIFLHLQNLRDIHLHSNLAREIEPNGNALYVYIFTIVAFFLILIACINFMNLSTAQALERSKEIGIRKVLGSQRLHLIFYFFIESVVFATLAFVISCIAIQLLLPAFNTLAGKSIQTGNWTVISGFFLIVLFSALLAGSYPALVLSSLQPITALQKKSFRVTVRPGDLSLRKALVILQFTISIGLICCTLITYQQFDYIRTKNLGLDKEYIIAIRNIPWQVKSKYTTFKDGLLSIPGVRDVSASMEEPSREIRDTGPVYAEGMLEGENTKVIDIQAVDFNYVHFMGLVLVAGTTFPSSLARTTPYDLNERRDIIEHINSAQRAYVLNETAVQAIGWKSPQEALGKLFSWRNSMFELQRGPVVGVVKDFHQESLRNTIDPVVLVYEPVWLIAILVKIDSENIPATLAAIEQKWQDLFPQYQFEYDFLDDLFERLYTSEQQQIRILAFFSGITIVIALLGIFGLAAHTAERRTKEIGIRKVLGASVSSIVILFARQFLGLIMLAVAIAAPIAWYFMRTWLDNFAYKINLDIRVFLLSGVVVLAVALLTLSYQSVKTAMMNPVHVLRYE
jgi:putative ABC transport system permease protein